MTNEGKLLIPSVEKGLRVTYWTMETVVRYMRPMGVFLPDRNINGARSGSNLNSHSGVNEACTQP